MKKSHSHILQCLSIGVLLLSIQQYTHAQVPAPASWQTFVGSTQNITLQDTFRLQSFEETAKDNWRYEASEGTTVLNASQEDITEWVGRHFFKLPPKESIRFEHYSLRMYTDIRTTLKYKRKGLNIKDKLWIKIYRDDTNAPIGIETKDETALSSQISNSPGIDIYSLQAAIPASSGYYCLDSIYAFGTIPSYSLFFGSGSWGDTTLWSHLPAARSRNALINGQVVVNTDTQCRELHIGEGSLAIAPDANFTASIVSIHRTFKEKGQWYFVSFPFDIYPDGVDRPFEHKSDAPNSGGNYFYILSYNGEKRATSASSKMNWEVLSPKDIPAGQPLFRKNKGYLISIDAKSSQQTIRFSARQTDIAAEFGKSGTISIQAFPSSDNEHSGWYLCGNPLPAPLSLSQIESNPALDGNVYIYNGSTYTAYALGSNYALPPFTAFFVKASTDTELTIRPTSVPSPHLLSGATLPLRLTDIDPSANTPTGQCPLFLQVPQSRINGNIIHLSDLPSEGQIRIISFDGLLMQKHTTPAGSSSVPISLKKGIYIIHIHSGNYRAHHKYIQM